MTIEVPNGHIAAIAGALATGGFYKDFARPTVQVIGKAIAKKVADVLGRAKRKVPAKRLTKPSPEVLGPVLLNALFTADDSILKSMYVKLLASAMDKRHKAKAHPAFAHVISQLSPQEAVFLMILRDNPGCGLVRADVENLVKRTMVQYSEVTLREDLLVANHGIDLATAAMYFDHLLSLGVLSWGLTTRWLKIQNAEEDGFTELRVHRSYPITQISEFGRSFVSTCLPAKLPPKQSKRKRRSSKRPK